MIEKVGKKKNTPEPTDFNNIGGYKDKTYPKYNIKDNKES